MGMIEKEEEENKHESFITVLFLFICSSSSFVIADYVAAVGKGEQKEDGRDGGKERVL